MLFILFDILIMLQHIYVFVQYRYYISMTALYPSCKAVCEPSESCSTVTDNVATQMTQLYQKMFLRKNQSHSWKFLDVLEAIYIYWIISLEGKKDKKNCKNCNYPFIYKDTVGLPQKLQEETDWSLSSYWREKWQVCVVIAGVYILSSTW